MVGTDGSVTATDAVRRAAALAGALEMPLHIVSVYRPAAVLAGGAPPELPMPATVLAECDAALGAPAEAILRIAATEGADLIVVGNRGMHGARRILGSVPNTISHTALCDVLVVATT